MTICLSPEEIITITHRKKYSAQSRILNNWGIDYRVRPDGTLMVMREAFDSYQAMRKAKRVEPNWEAVR